MSGPGLDPRQLRNAFGAFMTGVTVVTAHDADGRPIGFTANSFASVSLDPPLLLVCIARSSRNYAVFTTASGFAVNVLAETQKEVSNTFARPVEDRFASVDWMTGPNGAPVFPGAAAWFDCTAERVIEAGDHAILIGRVEAFENAGLNGLGYARGGYFTAAMEAKAAGPVGDGPVEAAAVAERGGAVLLVEDAAGRLGLPRCTVAEGSAPRRIADLIQGEVGLAATVGFLFSVYQDRAAGRQHVVYRVALGEGMPARGRLVGLDRVPFDRLDSAQTADILRRYAAESALGNFGLYVGNETAGRVHPLPREA